MVWVAHQGSNRTRTLRMCTPCAPSHPESPSGRHIQLSWFKAAYLSPKRTRVCCQRSSSQTSQTAHVTSRGHRCQTIYCPSESRSLINDCTDLLNFANWNRYHIFFYKLSYLTLTYKYADEKTLAGRKN
jgi:hypothetical protein